MRPRTAVLLCAALGFVLALLTLPNGFVIDDSYLVVHNQQLQHLSNIPGFYTQAWGNDSGGADHSRINVAYYRPLTSTLMALEYAVFGLNPAGFHLVSALLHGLATGLCAALCLALLGSLSGGLLGGLLFAVHPVHTEAIAAVTYQTTLLAATLAAATLWLTHRALRGGPLPGLLVGLGTLLALLAKEEAASLPLLVLALVVFARPQGEARRRAVLCVAAAGCATVLFLGIRGAIVRSSGITYFQGAPSDAVWFTMLRVLWLYAGLLVAPLHLCPFYDWFIVPIEGLPSPKVLAGAGLLLALAWAIVSGARRWPQVALGLSWLLLGLLPVMQIIPILNVAAERFLYLPSFGWALACAAVSDQLAGAGRRRAAVYAAAAVVLGLYGVRSATRLREWRDDLTLNQATARDFPQTPTPLFNQAQIYMDRRDWPQAEAVLQQALPRTPDFLQSYLQSQLAKVRSQRAAPR